MSADGHWLTTLADAKEASKCDLHHARWQIELGLRSIKAVMQMGVLEWTHCIFFAPFNLHRATHSARMRLI
ncbi:MAG: hypothetical protein Q7J80_10100 [Anaerolineales bacterium]|nr:hypothetical protein [Anaerolineales bacterium]